MTDKPNSTELINLAHREWRNRQKRKGHDDEVAWTSGWISGYLTGKGSLSSELKKDREGVLDIINKGKDALYQIEPDGYWTPILQAKMDVLLWIEERVESLRGEP